MDREPTIEELYYVALRNYQDGKTPKELDRTIEFALTWVMNEIDREGEVSIPMWRPDYRIASRIYRWAKEQPFSESASGILRVRTAAGTLVITLPRYSSSPWRFNFFIDSDAVVRDWFLANGLELPEDLREE